VDDDLEGVVKQLKRRYWGKLRKKRNVRGFSGSLKPRNDEADGELCFRVYVTVKQPLSALVDRDVLPRFLKLNNDVPVDVFEVGEVVAFGTAEEAQEKHRPVVAGISAMGWWENATACTLGGFAKNRGEGEEQFIGVIANNHCAANENKASKGTPYTQPSKSDGGVRGDEVATLWRFVEIKFSEFACPYRNVLHGLYRALAGEPENRVDIALMKLGDVDYDLSLMNVGPLYGKRRPQLHEKVQKMGRTTGHTESASVIDLDWNGTVGYSRGKAFFTDCVLIAKPDFSAGGDSSSPIGSTGDEPELLAQLFAGSTGYTIGCYIDNIEEELEVDVYPFSA